MTEPRYCRECAVELSPRNTSGFCRRHVAKRNATDPTWREKQRAGIRLKLQADPEYVERLRVSARRASALRDPQVMKERWLQERIWEKSNAAHPPGSPSRRQAGRSISAAKLADIPPHLREMYRELTRSGLRAAEARAMVMEHHETEMRRWRQRTPV
ncbi:MAG TPA: hypothetical protein VNR51_03795 [Hyphomicrobium sp.]|nr:hypothetical protein [Hyphomicrobium sp.]